MSIERFDLISMRPFEVETMNRLEGGDWVRYDDHLEVVASLRLEIGKLKDLAKRPMQPVINGRFKENKIVSYCLDNKTDMNDIARQDFTVEDKEQFAQLIGYSLGGYSSLSYVTDESYRRAKRSFDDE